MPLREHLQLLIIYNYIFYTTASVLALLLRHRLPFLGSGPTYGCYTCSFTIN
jgi:hypothetical protein